MIDRRRFMTGLSGVVVASSFSVHAQSKPMPVIGFLNGSSREGWAQPVAAFHKGLAEAGFVEGRNVAIEYRWAEGRADRSPALAAELVGRQVDVLVATGGSAAVQAAKAATKTIPVVFGVGFDPVEQGIVASLGRPGGNVTGVTFLTSELEAKRLGLLRELVPKDATIAVLLNPDITVHALVMKDVEAAARTLGQRVHILRASNEAEIGAAFAAFAELPAAALLVGAAPYFFTRRDTIVALAARHAIPAIYVSREFAVAGGLMSYGTNIDDATRHVGLYAGRILKGEKPADLPVLQSSRFEFVVNLSTAKALGLTIPPAILLGANEVIE
jgi:putative tryptophan/tyrosine transport system substrate-binding protein